MSAAIQPWEAYTPEQLADYVNEMIVHDFTGLLNLLYRLDVSEDKIRKLLNEMQQEDAGRIIAATIIERQLQKIQSRAAYKQPGEIPEADKW